MIVQSEDAKRAMTEKECELKKRERQALLMMVDAIEEYLDMPRTSEIRQFAKDNGYYDKRTCK